MEVPFAGLNVKNTPPRNARLAMASSSEAVTVTAKMGKSPRQVKHTRGTCCRAYRYSGTHSYKGEAQIRLAQREPPLDLICHPCNRSHAHCPNGNFSPLVVIPGGALCYQSHSIIGRPMERKMSFGLVLAVMIGFSCSSEAYVFVVGGRDGWVRHPLRGLRPLVQSKQVPSKRFTS